MKIIKKGNKVQECKRCGCVMEFDVDDVKSKIVNITISEFFGMHQKWNIEYIKCPQCGEEIEVGHKCLVILMSDLFNYEKLIKASNYYKEYNSLNVENGISDCLYIGVDFTPEKEGALVVMRREGDNIYILNQFRNEEAMELYNKLIGVKENSYEAEWKYWDGWMSNHDKRIDDATCSKCGYVHFIVKGSPDLLSDYCCSCGSKMKKL